MLCPLWLFGGLVRPVPDVALLLARSYFEAEDMCTPEVIQAAVDADCAILIRNLSRAKENRAVLIAHPGVWRVALKHSGILINLSQTEARSMCTHEVIEIALAEIQRCGDVRLLLNLSSEPKNVEKLLHFPGLVQCVSDHIECGKKSKDEALQVLKTLTAV